MPSLPPELLAPAGTLEAVMAVLDAGADAVYVSGKALNMRQHRASYNFDDAELSAAITAVHARERKLYVTLNSLIFTDQLDLLRRTLETLGRLRPDALIVQDLAVASLAREICVHLPLHASTMMNVHNAATAEVLALLGFTRIIASRDITLDQMAEIGRISGLEMECFVHGDLCIAQGAQCYLSGVLFGESSNCGRCMKPCRWDWQLRVNDAKVELAGPTQGTLLARRDLCLLDHLPALMQAGIASLKIEGRMRSAAFLAPIVNLYRRELDRYLANPETYQADPAALAEIRERRVRDFTTGQTFGRPGPEGINPTGQREPRFFSTAGPRTRLTTGMSHPPVTGCPRPELIAHVSTAAAVQAALAAGADTIYFNGDGWIGGGSDLNADALLDLHAFCDRAGQRLVVLMPAITDARDLDTWAPLLETLADLGTVGVGVSNLGALQRARDLRFPEILADIGLNAANPVALDELSTLGITRATAALEMHWDQLTSLIARARLDLDLLVQGPLPGMLLEHCILGSALGTDSSDRCSRPCQKGHVTLVDKQDTHYPVLCDRRCRNHLYTGADLCLLPHLGALLALKPTGLRIEAQLDPPVVVETVVRTYRETLDALISGQTPTVSILLETLSAATGRPLMDGPLDIRRRLARRGQRKERTQHA